MAVANLANVALGQLGQGPILPEANWARGPASSGQTLTGPSCTRPTWPMWLGAKIGPQPTWLKANVPRITRQTLPGANLAWANLANLANLAQGQLNRSQLCEGQLGLGPTWPGANLARGHFAQGSLAGGQLGQGQLFPKPSWLGLTWPFRSEDNLAQGQLCLEPNWLASTLLGRLFS